MPRDLAGLLAESAVECRLAAARLAFRKIDVEPQAFQHIDYGHSYFRKQLVDDAGDEQGNPGGHGETQIVAPGPLFRVLPETNRRQKSGGVTNRRLLDRHRDAWLARHAADRHFERNITRSG